MGICPAVTPTGVARLAKWLMDGFAGEMSYIARRQQAYEHPAAILESVKSLVMLATVYGPPRDASPSAGAGRIARYARGTDYHDLLHKRMDMLGERIRHHLPGARFRGVVDTAPLLEREFAQIAGLGWVGKNTMLLNRGLGSYFFLSALLIDQELAYDAPFVEDFCGSCRACLDACPTEAFVAPYVLDSRRCISYLTIELRTAIPTELRPKVGDWLFGCDICQEVCPWNQHAVSTIDPSLQPSAETTTIELTELFYLDEDSFRARFRGTAMWRAKRRGILRNAALVLGNQRALHAIPALTRGLEDREPLVRGACAWALGQLERSLARDALRAREIAETDPAVRDEIARALAGVHSSETG